MSNIIHSFRGYTSFVYRLIFIGIFPPALFILTWFFADPAYLSWSWVIVFFYITYESIGDYMVFAGICNKENNNYVFLKTSYLGETMFRQVVLADLIRRFVVAAVMGSIAWYREPSRLVCITIGMIYAVALILVNATRYCEAFLVYLAVWGIALWGLAWLVVLVTEKIAIWKLTELTMPAKIVVMAVVIAINVITMQHMMLRERGVINEE